jgi:hypothetical protein
MINRLGRHFEKHNSRTPWDFCWRTAIEGMLLSFAVVIVLNMFVKEQPRDMIGWSAAQLIAYAVLAAPVIETLVFQVIPISIARALRAPLKVQILISAGLFALPHFIEGLGVGIGAGVIGGLYFAYAFAHWARKSFWTALWVTIVAHFLRNAISVSMLLAGRGLIEK